MRSVGVALLVLFMFLGLLLTNILIAQLAKRFDECWEAQEVNYMYIRVQRLLDAEYLPALPPPFTLLSWPFWTWHLVRWLPEKLAKPMLVNPHTATFMQGRMEGRQGEQRISGFVIWKDSVTTLRTRRSVSPSQPGRVRGVGLTVGVPVAGHVPGCGGGRSRVRRAARGRGARQCVCVHAARVVRGM